MAANLYKLFPLSHAISGGRRRVWSVATALFLTACTVFSSGCSTHTSLAKSTQATNPATPPSQDQQHEAKAEAEIVNSKAFPENTLYELLVAELALSRGQYDLGFEKYTEQAQSSDDLNLIARATQVAHLLNRHEQALDLAERWHQIQPNNSEAKRVLVAELSHAMQLDRALDLLDELASEDRDLRFDQIAVSAVDGAYPNIEALLQKYRRIAENHPSNPSVFVGLSVLYQAQSELQNAHTSIEIAYDLDPDNISVIYQKYRVLDALGDKAAANTTYAALVEQQPENFYVRSHYAHQLIRLDLDQAKKQYEILSQLQPDNYDVKLNVGLIAIEQKHYDEAKEIFKALIDEQQHVSLAHFNLGVIALNTGSDDTALEHFTQVTDGSRFVEAVINAASIIAGTDGLKSARKFIGEKRNQTSGRTQERLYVAEAQVLTRNGLAKSALELYNEGLVSHPESIQLRYSRALLYANNNRHRLAEEDFKKVIAREPDNADTLNALGYTLLEQTDRIDDASRYILAAHEIDPDNPAILDSVGWLAFKQGKTKRALKYLRKAHAIIQDGEITAHMIEILWRLGRKKEARKVLSAGLETDPESSHIKDTVQRLGIQP